MDLEVFAECFIHSSKMFQLYSRVVHLLAPMTSISFVAPLALFVFIAQDVLGTEDTSKLLQHLHFRLGLAERGSDRTQLQDPCSLASAQLTDQTVTT